LESDACSDLSDGYSKVQELSLKQIEPPPRSLLEKLKFEASSTTAVL
jgi:hypothetical protein